MFVFSFGWVLVMLLTAFVLFNLHLAFKNPYDNDANIAMCIFFTAFTATPIVASYHDATVRFPNRLSAVEAKISNTKAMLGDNTLEGVALKQSIAKLISEREDIIYEIKSRDMRPTVLFRTVSSVKVLPSCEKDTAES